MNFQESKATPPESIQEFRGINENQNWDIPEAPENRKCTDKIFLVVFILSGLTTIILVGYASVINTNYQRLLNGYDKCGDTCGVQNEPITNINCSGKNLTQKPFMKFNRTLLWNSEKHVNGSRILPDVCVDECDAPNRLLFHRCIPSVNLSLTYAGNDFLNFAEFFDDFHKSYTIICLVSITGLALSFGLLLLFLRCNFKIIIFFILTLALILLCTFATYLWYRFIQNTTDTKLITFGIVSTIALFLLSIFVCYFHDRYSLVAEIMAEASICIKSMPALIFVPILNIFILAALISGMVLLSLLMSTNQYLEKVDNTTSSLYKYSATPLSEAAITYLVLSTIWLISFANGCQCIIVAGSVSAYYFSENKSNLRFPVSSSCKILFRYHLGTVSFGSLCITIVTSARVTINFLEKRIRRKCILICFHSALGCFEALIQYLTKQAYIQTAMHGKSLYISGIRAARLLWSNSMDAIALDVVADFIMVCATISIMLLSISVGILAHYLYDLKLNYFWSILLIGAGIVGFAAYFFIQVINVTVETIFICFCEDKLMNDGVTRPYFMSGRLKDLVNRAKEITKRRGD